ncbi:DUF5723 family protein [Sinomicrobium soli]|uniref:DUF5723 family protein n=1 Tax=Sinomicrobium sp. N-1-3-6 TaxID=2219864 RepID=UPI000DCAE362|nr:DUF5723 family protein [Sinomicrobium sp. N-1-3-6]RAV29814.1 hypothetical protein DN748_06800 [Sinomicrobium sp. N-1-3-6]
MKLQHLLLLLCMPVFYINAQNKPLLYDFTAIPQSLLLNPAAGVDNRWYAGVPLLSGVQAGAGSSGFSVYDLFADDEVSFNDKVGKLVRRMSPGDVVSTSQQAELFNIGFKGDWTGRDYYSFGMYQETDAFVYWPGDLAVLAYDGNKGHIGEKFDLGHLDVTAEMLTVLHFGWRRKVSDRLKVGVRAKWYSGMVNIHASGNSGYFVTEYDPVNFYVHRILADVALRTSGYQSLEDIPRDGNEGKEVWKELRSRMLFSGNFGLGMDLGLTYHPAKQWTVTASLLDFGFVRHTEDVKNYTLKGSYDLEGVELFLNPAEGENPEEYWEDLKDKIEDQLPYEKNARKYTTRRAYKMYGAVNYAFGIRRNKKRYYLTDYENYINNVGAQLFVVNRPKGPLASITAFYSRKLTGFLETKVTYTADRYSQTNIGGGLAARMGNVQFYLLADDIPGLLNLAKANYGAVQFGFNYIFPHSGGPF